MKTFIALLVIVAMSMTLWPASCLAESADDDWTAPDKIVHAVISCALTFLAYNIYRKNTKLSKDQSSLAAFFTSLTAGTVKEALDERFSEKDLIADAVAAGAGIAIAVEF